MLCKRYSVQLYIVLTGAKHTTICGKNPADKLHLSKFVAKIFKPLGNLSRWRFAAAIVLADL